MARPRCLGHVCLGRHAPVNVVAGLQPDLANELALRPTIAFAKRMSGIQLAEKIRSPAGKHRGIEAHKVLLGRQSLQGLLQRRFEEVCEPEEMASLGYYSLSGTDRPIGIRPGKCADESL